MSNIKIFKNNEFGEIRTLEQDGKPLFCGQRCGEGSWICQATERYRCTLQVCPKTRHTPPSIAGENN